MAEDRRRAPESPTELGLRFGLPVAGLGEIANLGEIGAGAGGLPLADGLQAAPGQSGAEGLAELPRESGTRLGNDRVEDPYDGP
ncbi:MAG: hypothetical protein ACOY93_15435 [Bacillota bacterium]